MLSLIIFLSVAIFNLNSEGSFLARSLALSLIVQELQFLNEIYDLLQVVLSLNLKFEFQG